MTLLDTRRGRGLLIVVVVLMGGLIGVSPALAADPIEPLARDCAASELPPHTGFQVAPACVETSFGEVSAQQNNPTLLIVDAPRRVRANEDITLTVSFRNLIRDRFLAAGAGGYYLESATLVGGLTRGHAHASCQAIDGVAPQPDRQASFRAIEDGGGSGAPDTVTVTVPGVPVEGEARCSVWAGDGSDRIPMMQFANEVPAFDSVRVEVQGRGSRGPTRGDADSGG